MRRDGANASACCWAVKNGTIRPLGIAQAATECRKISVPIDQFALGGLPGAGIEGTPSQGNPSTPAPGLVADVRPTHPLVRGGWRRPESGEPLGIRFARKRHRPANLPPRSPLSNSPR